MKVVYCVENRVDTVFKYPKQHVRNIVSLIAKFMEITWGPHSADRNQVAPMLAPWTLLSGMVWGAHYYVTVVVYLE